MVGCDITARPGARVDDEWLPQRFAEFLREYRAGRTPNPDVLCNAEIKFKAFLDHALKLGAACIATGHYARVARTDGTFCLMKGIDPRKDQSYFLHRLDQYQLSKTLFPLGGLLKSQVREIAEAHGLPNHAKKDSTGICFIGERPFREFLARYLPLVPGAIVTPEGKIVGQHQGLMYHTLGQRQGLGIGGTPSGNGEPWFVAEKHMDRNELVVVQGHDHPLLLKHELLADNATWISGKLPATSHSMAAKTRYRQDDATCELEVKSSNDFALRFARAQWAITPGQSAVVYAGDVCLGGGVIA
jgi:tRNA-specific 2-thiouridylase